MNKKEYELLIHSTAEGIREFLQEFNDIGYDVKYEALKLVTANFQEALRND
jgi:hypothetical protein